MNILFAYLKNIGNYLFLLFFFLAAINQIFSLLDPWIFRKIIDEYVTKFSTKTHDEFIEGAGILILAANGRQWFRVLQKLSRLLC